MFIPLLIPLFFLFKIFYLLLLSCVWVLVPVGRSEDNFWNSSSLLPPWPQGLNSEHQVCTPIAFTHGATLKALLRSWTLEHFSAISLEFVFVCMCLRPIHCVIHIGLELLILLPPPHHHWDHSPVPLYHTVPLHLQLWFTFKFVPLFDHPENRGDQSTFNY